MTEINIYSNMENGKKGTQKSKTKQAPYQYPEVEIFASGNNGDKKGIKVPYRPAEEKMPTIFDFKANEYTPPPIPKTKDKSIPKIPYMSKEMRREFDEKTTIGIFNGIIQKQPSKKNTEQLMKYFYQMDYQNYKFVLRSFDMSGLSLTYAVMNTSNLNDKQKQEVLNHLADLGKKTADYGNQRSDDVYPKVKDLIKKYEKQDNLSYADQKRLTADFKKFVNRSDTLQTPKPAMPNGKVDRPFKQGQTGDCWLLSGIKALSMTKEGQAMLDKVVTVDNKGNAIVKLKGVGKTYTVTARDLKCSNELSSGDTDIRAIEIAMDRYMRETVTDDLNSTADIDGNTVGMAFKLLADPSKTVETPRPSNQNVRSIVDIISKRGGLKGYAGTTGMSGRVDPSGFNAVDDRGKPVTMYNAHAYAMKEITKDSVYLVNPHDTARTIKIPLNQYLAKFDLISLTEVTNLK